MEEKIKDLIAQYEERLRNQRYDQYTDDALSQPEYLMFVNTMENVIENLKALLN